MNYKWFRKLHLLVCVVLVLGRNCNAGILRKGMISCGFSGISCVISHMLNIYGLDECTQAGIFPDSTNDFNFYVCLSDGTTGFFKYGFSCQEGHFFDPSQLSCFPKSATDPAYSDSPTTTTPSETTTTNTGPTPTTSTASTETTIADPTSTTSTASTETTIADPTSTTSTASIETTIADPTPTTSTASTEITTINATTTKTTKSHTPSVQPTTPTITTPSVTPAPFLCPGSGIFPNPDNCKMYYRCSTSLKVFFYICPGKSYFNENVLKCSLIITPKCQEQISKNLSTTVPTTTPLTTTTTTTHMPTTPTPTTTIQITKTTLKQTTTTPKPTTTTTIPRVTTIAPFICPTAGIFENPSDCKTYYRCSTSGKAFRYVCPGNTYFNEFNKKCSLALTPRCKNLVLG